MAPQISKWTAACQTKYCTPRLVETYAGRLAEPHGWVLVKPEAAQLVKSPHGRRLVKLHAWTTAHSTTCSAACETPPPVDACLYAQGSDSSHDCRCKSEANTTKTGDWFKNVPVWLFGLDCAACIVPR